ncbi:DUF368 domain-containing protein [Candidatus Woesearchaeota archaeon]|nr:DUF368 domain-containing protein [Candidatus Woesearchaeota archaeon]
MKHPALFDLVLVFIRGLCMGIADAIPGVSGGTIAFITGIYDRLLHAISSVKGKWFSLLLHGKFKDSFSALKEIHFTFLLPLLAGIALSLFLFSGVMNSLLLSRPAVTYAFFFGLILASAWLLSKKIHLGILRNVVSLVLGFALAYLIAGATAATVSHSLPVIFFSAAVAICAMILPGISGAFILLLLGQYQFLIQALQDLNTAIILTFGAGAVVGLLSFVRLLDYVLHHHRALTLSFLTGLMIGSLRVPFVSIVGNGGASLSVLLWGIAGFMLVFVLEKVFDRKSSL